jgi:uncharacterized protein (TIGR00369 family)
MSTLGIRLVEATPERTVAELDFRPEVQQPTGIFHAGALLGLADTAATNCCIQVINSGGTRTDAPFPLAVQVSASLVRNVNAGTVRAIARPLHRGRTMIVIQTEVSDAAGRTLTLVTSTHLVLDRPAPPAPDGGAR